MFLNFDQVMQQPQQAANFFHTFGFLTIGNIVTQNQAQNLINAYDKVTRSRRGLSFPEALQKGNIIEIATVEEFPEFSDFYLSSNFQSLYEILLGKDWLFVTSDISVFPNYIQSWHRDMAGFFPSVKMGYYANSPYYVGGEMRYIPGSHKIGDRYANNLQRALAWPGPNARPGGMNERGFLPESFNYAASPANNDFTYIDHGSGDGTNTRVRNMGFALPHAALKPGPLDVVAFDSRGIHSGTVGVPSHIRAMSAACLSINPFDQSIDLKGMGITQSRDQLAEEIVAYIVTNQLFQHIPETYHPKGIEPPLPSKHKYKIKYESGSRVSATFGDYPQRVEIDYDIDGFTKAVAEKGHLLPKYFLDYVASKVSL